MFGDLGVVLNFWTESCGALYITHKTPTPELTTQP